MTSRAFQTVRSSGLQASGRFLRKRQGAGLQPGYIAACRLMARSASGLTSEVICRLVHLCALTWLGSALIACNIDTHLGYRLVVGRDDGALDAAVPPGEGSPFSEPDSGSVHPDDSDAGAGSGDHGATAGTTARR